MKIKYILAGILIVLSFYITDKSMIYIRSKNPIMQEIISKQDDYKVEAVNAIINDNTIIPGINGKEVDVNKTFNKMDDLGYFNDLYIIYSYSAPNLSLNDNKDKIIIKGNEQKNMVALIIDHNPEVSNYLDSVNIKYTNIVYLEDKIKLEIDLGNIKKCDAHLTAFIIYRVFINVIFEYDLDIDEEKVTKEVTTILKEGLLN